MEGDTVAYLVDKMLEAKKTLAGKPSWENSPRPDEEKRLVRPLRINDQPCHADLHATAFPSYGNSKEKWRIMIMAPSCIWRVDYVFDEPHINSLDKPSDLKEFSFTEPHYHAWADNRRFSSRLTLPDCLKDARILPSNVRTFENAFRWFCKKINIEQPSNATMIDLPPRDKLL